jgi:hypothetical protein
VHAETYRGVWRHRGIAIAVPRTVSDELWRAAIAGLKRYGASGANRVTHMQLLPGLMFCECGTRMHIKRASLARAAAAAGARLVLLLRLEALLPLQGAVRAEVPPAR